MKESRDFGLNKEKKAKKAMFCMIEYCFFAYFACEITNTSFMENIVKMIKKTAVSYPSFAAHGFVEQDSFVCTNASSDVIKKDVPISDLFNYEEKEIRVRERAYD